MISPINLSNIFNVYSLTGDEEEPKYRLVGRFLDIDSGLEVLFDPHGILVGLQGPPSEKQNRSWRSLVSSPYLHVVSLAEIRDGTHPELLQEMNVPQITGQQEHPDTTTFQYSRHGLRDPLLVQFQQGKAHLNGQPLSRIEVQQLLDTVASGQAEIRRYGHGEAQMRKTESDLQNLVKMEPELRSALGKAKGSLDEDTYRTLSREIFMDAMIPGMGGKKAYAHMMENPEPGIHIRSDLNSFKAINSLHGFEAGDQAIKAAGKALLDAKREADEKYSPPKAPGSSDPAERDLDELMQSRSWRPGGDEVHVLIPEHEKALEHASYFLRKFREKMDAIPPIGGTHRISASIGLGHTPEEADRAQLHAKAAKKATGRLPGMEETHVHSLIHGHEGPVPVDEPPAVKPEPAPEVADVLKPLEPKAA